VTATFLDTNTSVVMFYAGHLASDRTLALNQNWKVTYPDAISILFEKAHS